MTMTVRRSGNTYIASGDNVAGFGETPEIAEQHFVQLRDADRRQRKTHFYIPETADKQRSKTERKRQRRRHQRARRGEF